MDSEALPVYFSASFFLFTIYCAHTFCVRGDHDDP